VSDKNYHDRHDTYPTIPKDSGITTGIGYDLGQGDAQPLPQAIQDTREIYQQLDDLPPGSQAALVSLIYNRGIDLKGQVGRRC
jgi:hypothetical protein